MAKVKITIEIDERFFAWEMPGDLLRHSIDFIEKSIYTSEDWNYRVSDSTSCSQADHIWVTGAQLVPEKEGIWKDYDPEN